MILVKQYEELLELNAFLNKVENYNVKVIDIKHSCIPIYHEDGSLDYIHNEYLLLFELGKRKID